MLLWLLGVLEQRVVEARLVDFAEPLVGLLFQEAGEVEERRVVVVRHGNDSHPVGTRNKQKTQRHSLISMGGSGVPVVGELDVAKKRPREQPISDL